MSKTAFRFTLKSLSAPPKKGQNVISGWRARNALARSADRALIPLFMGIRESRESRREREGGESSIRHGLMGESQRETKKGRKGTQRAAITELIFREWENIECGQKEKRFWMDFERRARRVYWGLKMEIRALQRCLKRTMK